MAIYHFSGSVISRSQGRSAVACAAYRSAKRLQDGYYGRVHDYSKKQDVVYEAVLLPEGAPLWMADREKLWNAVEEVEKRKDAQLAREFNFALPRELTIEQGIALAREFVQETFVSQGMIADLCVHDHLMKNGEKQPHVHVMLTLRSVSDAGFGQKVRAWNAKSNLLAWRKGWSDAVNHHLALYGHDVRIDHRTLEAQGIDLEPQYKIGAGEVSERLARFEDHQRIARENGEKLLLHPEIALEAITQQQSTFTHQDIARFVNRHTVDTPQFSAAYERVKACSSLVYLGRDEKGEERFTTQAMLDLESQMVKTAVSLSERVTHRVGERGLKRGLSISLTDEQRRVFDDVVKKGEGLQCVVGYAGTGKSYLLGAAKKAWEREGYRVWGGTLSGIAAENLMGSSGIESRTLSSWQYAWERGEGLLGSRDVLVIDEAGMLGSRQMKQVLDVVFQGHAKVVLVGDPEQLQAIGAGAAFRAIVEKVGCSYLTQIQRQQEGWQQLATQELASGQTDKALNQYWMHDHIHVFETQDEAQAALLEKWQADRLLSPDKSSLMLSYLREDVRALNEQARILRQAQGECGLEKTYHTERGVRSFAVGDRVYFLKNDRKLGVMNGTLGTITLLKSYGLSIRLDKDLKTGLSDRIVEVDTRTYPYLDHGYAATIHKSQGVTVDRSYVLASKFFDRHVTYVALSRHKESMDLYYSQSVFQDKPSFMHTLSRERSKDVSLDYVAESFAEVRGMSEMRGGVESASQHIHPSSESQEPEVSSKKAMVESQKSDRHTREASLAAFKARYERENPEVAARHQDQILETEEKAFEKRIAAYAALYTEYKQLPMTMRDKQYQAMLKEMAGEPQLLAYAQKHHPDFYQTCVKIQQQLDMSRGQNRGQHR